VVEDAARRLLDRLRDFAASLEDDERALLGALLAPGIALAHQDGEADVEGFAMIGWHPGHLPEALERAVRESNLRVDGW
jgi:hypothetical protein